MPLQSVEEHGENVGKSISGEFSISFWIHSLLQVHI